MTAPSPEQVEAIVAGLTKARRKAVVDWPELGRARLASARLRDLSDQQWVCRRLGGAEERWFLSPLGLAVRQHLLSKDQ